MTPKRIMLIAGEASGDMLAAELVNELRAAFQRQNTYASDLQPLRADLAPRFFGAGGPRMAEAGVEVTLDMMRHSLIGVPGVRDYLEFRGRLKQLISLAREREPHAIICVDFSLFNAVFAAAIKKEVHKRRGTFNNWEPRLIKYISPQVWGSRPGRARQVARDFDLLLSIFPFEQAWYAEREPELRVAFVGHPMIDRFAKMDGRPRKLEVAGETASSAESQPPPAPLLLLLPGSRPGELRRHLPPMIGALELMLAAVPDLRVRMVLPSESLVTQAKMLGLPGLVEVRCGGLAESLAEATVAIAKTGTVTMECAFFGVPAVTLYKTSWFTYEVGRRIVKVKWATMANLLAGREVYPEFIQHAATPENISIAALEFLREPAKREKVRAQLADVVDTLGGPGASRRAAEAIVKILP